MTYVCYRTEHIEAEGEDEYGCLLLPCEHPKLLGPVTATPSGSFFARERSGLPTIPGENHGGL